MVISNSAPLSYLKRAPYSRLVALLLALFMVGCGPTKTPEQAVWDRSTARWEAILAEDYAQEYALHSPGFRSIKSLRAHENYRTGQPVRWTGYEIQEVTCESAEVCTAVVKIDYEVRAQVAFVGVQEFFSNAHETWVFTDGNWYYLPKQLGR